MLARGRVSHTDHINRMSCVDLTLDSVVSICRTLDSILKKSFGPNALNVLLCPSGGKLLLTNSSLPILQSLNISHPIGRMLIQAVQSHVSMTGDGSKTFLILVTEILFNIAKRVTANRNIERMAFVKAIENLKSEVIPGVILPKLLMHSDKQDFTSRRNICGNNEHLRDIVDTYLQSKLSRATRKHIADLVVACVLRSLTGLEPGQLQNSLYNIIENFELVFHENVGGSPLNSRITNGLVITRDIVRNEKPDMVLENIQMIGMNCSLEDSDLDATFSGATGESLHKALLWKQKHLKEYVSILQTYNVTLLLTTAHVSDLMVHLCKEANIFIAHCVEVEELEHFSRTTGCNLVQEASDLKDSIHTHICHVDQCKTINISGRVCLQLINPRKGASFPKYTNRDGNSQLSGNTAKSCITETPQPEELDALTSSATCQSHDVNNHADQAPYTVLICSPTHGLCSQYKSAIHGALKAVLMWMDYYSVLDMITLSGDIQRHTLAGCSIEGGGKFEILVHKVLESHLRNCVDSDGYDAVKVVGSAMLAVPLRLLENSYALSDKKLGIAQLLDITSKSSNENAFTGLDSQGTCDQKSETVKHKENPHRYVDHKVYNVQGLEAKGGRSCLHSGSGIREPLAAKVLLLYHVFDTVIQMLRVDSIVSVTKIPKVHSQTDDED